MAGNSTRARATSDASDTHDFVCSHTDYPGGPECGFASTGWGTKRERDERQRAHKAEHESGEPMAELAVFRGEV